MGLLAQSKQVMRIFFFCHCIFLFYSTTFSQTEKVELSFHPTLQKQLIQLDSTYQFEDSEISFSMLKFYIGKIQLFEKEKTVTEIYNTFHLIDFSDSLPRNVVIETPENLEFDKIQFQLGVDSLTHEAGVMGGDLDPINGMYWAWNTGYINFKLEGKSPLCKNRDGSFQYHLGGYLPPFQTVQVIELPVYKKDNLTIELNLDNFLSQIDLKSEHTFMSPGAKAKELSEKASKIFSIKPL